MARLREGNHRAIVVAPQPEVLAKALRVPVGTVGGDDQHVSVGRESHAAEVDGVEELVEGEGGLGAVWRGSEKRYGRGHDGDAQAKCTNGCGCAIHTQGRAKVQKLSWSHDHPVGRFNGEIIIKRPDSDRRGDIAEPRVPVLMSQALVL